MLVRGCLTVRPQFNEGHITADHIQTVSDTGNYLCWKRHGWVKRDFWCIDASYTRSDTHTRRFNSLQVAALGKKSANNEFSKLLSLYLN